MSLIETGLEKSLENRQGRVISLAEPDGKNASKSTGTSPEAPSGRTGGVCSVLELEEVKNQSFFRSPEPIKNASDSGSALLFGKLLLHRACQRGKGGQRREVTRG